MRSRIVFLSRNYRLIVAPRKFEFLKINMLVLRTSNFQGATIRVIVPRQTLLSLLFTTKFSSAHYLKYQLNYLQLFEIKATKAKCKI